MSREEDIAKFLTEAGWNDTLTENMDADFSTRRFKRLHRKNGETAILMDADPGQRTTEFVVLAWLMRGINLSSPQIYAEQKQRGLVLMEDLGEGNVGRLIDGGRYEVEAFYMRAAETLAHLHQNFTITAVNDLRLVRYTSAVFTKQAELFLEGYFPLMLKRPPSDDERKQFQTAWMESLQPVDSMPQSLMLRDYMPDNVMDLPDRNGWRSLGLLDFQDAGIGPIAYDLTSFCEVVRRDGGDIYLRRVMARYFECMKPNCTWEALLKAGAILAAQRHTRILGILGNLKRKDPNSSKLSYLPRVEEYVKHVLKDAAVKPVRQWMTEVGLFT